MMFTYAKIIRNRYFRNLTKESFPLYNFTSDPREYSLKAISPIDGRYESNVETLQDYFSEYALIKYRTKVEIEWLKYLVKNNIAKVNGKPIDLNKSDYDYLDSIINSFNIKDALKVKDIEKVTNHDVKAVEYFVKDKITSNESIHNLKEYVHFSCTSEDINNLSYSLIMAEMNKNVLSKNIEELIKILTNHAKENAKIPMLSRTHGQVATPTTVGKEFANFAYRINKQYELLKKVKFTAKLNGAVGNFNAHMFAYPEYDWPKISREFIESLNLEFNPYTTQIEPHDSLANFHNYLSLINTILIGFCRDMWGYISIGYFKQKTKKGEVGSSTMPHKVNPIDFENCEGNLGLANAISQHLSTKLPISRFQRDLSDSTVMRNNGVAIGYSLIAYKSLIKGLSKIQVDQQKIDEDLDNHWEVLAEPIQTVMRKYQMENPYELLKEMTRGQKINKELLRNFINTLNIPESEKEAMLKLEPKTYIGNAVEMSDITKYT